MYAVEVRCNAQPKAHFKLAAPGTVMSVRQTMRQMVRQRQGKLSLS